MTTAPELIDPFHRALYGRLKQKLEACIEGLASGSAASALDDPATVAEKYAAQVAYIKALNDVLEVCEELERDRYGVKRED